MFFSFQRSARQRRRPLHAPFMRNTNDQDNEKASSLFFLGFPVKAPRRSIFNTYS